MSMPGATLKDLNTLDKAKVATLVEKVGASFSVVYLMAPKLPIYIAVHAVEVCMCWFP